MEWLIAVVSYVAIITWRYLPSVGHPRWLSDKESACSTEDPGLIPRSGRSPGEGNGNTLQYSCLENPMHSGAWQAIVHGVAKRDTPEATEHTCLPSVLVWILLP